MEGEARKYEMVEVGGWRRLIEEASDEAEALIGSIHGFSEMDAHEQLHELRSLLGRLAHNNANRYIAEKIAERMSVMEATAEYDAAMARASVMKSTFSVEV